ncbi:hypothetical protein ACFQ0M_15295 [Kitasatospora aburaviensis]
MLVRGDLWRLVTTFGPYELVGVTCADEGPESWFARSVLEHGGKVEVIVPAGAPSSAVPTTGTAPPGCS